MGLNFLHFSFSELSQQNNVPGKRNGVFTISSPTAKDILLDSVLLYEQLFPIAVSCI